MGLVADIREGLAANLADVADEIGAKASAYRLENPNPPLIHIFPGPVEYDSAGSRGEDVWTFIVQVLVGKSDSRAAQERLDDLLAPSGATSVKAAIESDATLGGVAFDLHVKSCTGAQDYQLAQGRMIALGADWTVEVRASGA